MGSTTAIEEGRLRAYRRDQSPGRRVGSCPVPGYPRPRRVAATRLGSLAALPAVEPLAERRGDADPLIRGVSLASDTVAPGDLFAALPGSRRHGAEFVPAAAAAGAVAVLTDPSGAPAAADAGLPALVVPDPRQAVGHLAAAVYGQPTDRLSVLGITGTNGKTSTSYLVEAGLVAAGRTTGLIGTVESRLAGVRLDSVRTTPEAPDLQALFAVAVERGVDSVVMEVSSHALALGRVNGTRYSVGAFTNFGVDHLDFHGTVEEYFAAKALLFDGRCAAEVINVDDPAAVKLVRPGTVTVSVDGAPAAAWRAAAVRRDGYGQTFEVHGPGGLVLAASVAMPGRHNVANALLAIAILAAAGVEPTVAVAGVAACTGVPGRMERVAAPGPVVGVVDFAHTPNAVAAALATLREAVEDGGRLLCVIGAGGDRDASKRPLMGEAAARGADELFITDDNPRTEDPAAIRAAVATGAAAVPGAAWHEVAGRAEAIAAAVAAAGPRDIVAVLGKGHEPGQDVTGRVLPFDDRVVLAEALGARFREDS
jgi:UDP-N-acetylmuramoyl-L-alanyl-D-glutamate--2,6-diaminopimelate ligase